MRCRCPLIAIDAKVQVFETWIKYLLSLLYPNDHLIATSPLGESCCMFLKL